MRVLALPRAYCVICTMHVAACSVRVLVYPALLLLHICIMFHSISPDPCFDSVCQTMRM